MLLFLVRHAHAEPGDPDELRPLSPRGRAEADRVGDQLAAHASPPSVVLTSPLLRARETAEAIADALSVEVRVHDGLSPGATADSLRAALRGASGAVAAVAHQPDCSHIAVELTGGDPGFPTASVAEIMLQP